MPQTTTGTVRNRTHVDGDLLRRRRIEAGLRIVDLADKASSTLSHVSDIERGRRQPSPPLLSRIADALRCKPADLLNPETPRAND